MFLHKKKLNFYHNNKKLNEKKRNWRSTINNTKSFQVQGELLLTLMFAELINDSRMRRLCNGKKINTFIWGDYLRGNKELK